MINTHSLSAAEVDRAVLAGLATSTNSPADQARFLAARRVVPLPCVVYVDEFCARNLASTEGEHLAWLITEDDPQSVFFDEATGQFGVCWGPAAGTNEYKDIGFRSGDPVDMYLA